jgi:hypothetical protein
MLDPTAFARAALEESLGRTAAAVDALFSAWLPLPEDPSRRLYEAMRYAAIGGGKRLRGFLVLEGARQFGVARDPALRTAAAIEMLHAYSLVHDDLPCMDDDDLRRGKPTVHKAFDEATAVLAGDALQANAFYVLAEPDTHSDSFVRAELCRCLARAAGPRGTTRPPAPDRPGAGRAPRPPKRETGGPRQRAARRVPGTDGPAAYLRRLNFSIRSPRRARPSPCLRRYSR